MTVTSLSRKLTSLLSFTRVEFGTRQISADDVDQAEIYTCEIGFAQVGRIQVGSVKCDAMQIRCAEIRLGQIRMMTPETVNVIGPDESLNPSWFLPTFAVK